MTVHDVHQLDLNVADVDDSAHRWLNLSITDRLGYLNRIRADVAVNSKRWAAVAIKGKDIPPGSIYAGEEWVSGPYPVLTWIDECIEVLESLDEDGDPLAGINTSTLSSGQLALRVFPRTLDDRLLLSGYEIDVWMQPEVTVSNLASNVAVLYRDPPGEARTSVVLGAGNITSIPALDVLYKLFVELEVVILKLNPVNDYLLEVFESCFESLISDGFLAVLSGGADVGAYLTSHDLVDSIHITGSAKTHDMIVFGAGAEAEQRRRANQPVMTKTITSELGGVSPTIIVPGPWSPQDVAFQAEHVASQKLHNSGFNCVASQVVLMQSQWELRADFVSALRLVMNDAPQRPLYYPGAEQRVEEAAERYTTAERLGPRKQRLLIDDVETDDYAFVEEFFAPALAITTIPMSSPAEFLTEAVRFCNEKLAGTLGANIIIHPETAKELGDRLTTAIGDLNYGCIGINAWTGVGYMITRAPWGAAPGHTIDDVQSGIGVVHNSLMLRRTQKTVVRGPFRPLPRNLRYREFHLSPKPLWFVTNKNAESTSRLLTSYTAERKKRLLPGLVLSALRG